jgi:ribosomal protein S18 acetylase RimI-like enzyme
VKGLSNLVREANAPVGAAEYRPARAEEWADGIALVLSHDGVPAGPEQVQEFMQFASSRGIDLSRLWLAGAAGQMEWAVLPVVSPGKTMLLLTPPQLPQKFDASPLVENVCAWFVQNGGHLAQVLADPPETPLRRFFIGRGFREIAELHYLQANARNISPPALPQGFHWHIYSPQTHPLFARAISASYQESLDCPALSGLREIEDVIAGHRASGEVDPRFWFVLMSPSGEACGVLLLTRVPRNDLSELVYLGIAPAFRGRGLGDVLMRQAFWAVRQMDLGRLTLAVDSKNAPALHLYYRHGLAHMGSKTAMLRDLRAGIGAGTAAANR